MHFTALIIFVADYQALQKITKWINSYFEAKIY